VKKIFVYLIIFSLGPACLLSQDLVPETSSVSFNISNFSFRTVEGKISKLSGVANFDTANLDLCSFDVCLDMSTINTENAKRDEHLKAEDFFDIKNHPKACFESQEVIKNSTGYLVTGALTMKGVKQIISIPFSYANKTFTGSFELNRLDYKIGPSGGFSVGKTVSIEIIAKQN